MLAQTPSIREKNLKSYYDTANRTIFAKKFNIRGIRAVTNALRFTGKSKYAAPAQITRRVFLRRHQPPKFK